MTIFISVIEYRVGNSKEMINISKTRVAKTNIVNKNSYREVSGKKTATFTMGKLCVEGCSKNYIRSISSSSSETVRLERREFTQQILPKKHYIYIHPIKFSNIPIHLILKKIIKK